MTVSKLLLSDWVIRFYGLTIATQYTLHMHEVYVFHFIDSIVVELNETTTIYRSLYSCGKQRERKEKEKEERESILWMLTDKKMNENERSKKYKNYKQIVCRYDYYWTIEKLLDLNVHIQMLSSRPLMLMCLEVRARVCVYVIDQSILKNCIFTWRKLQWIFLHCNYNSIQMLM